MTACFMLWSQTRLFAMWFIVIDIEVEMIVQHFKLFE